MKKELQGLYDLCISNGIAESDLKPYFATIESNLKTKRYGLVWEEQLEDIAVDLKNKFPILVEREDLSIKADPNGLTNCLIEGDNYESLTFLKNSGVRVDCIYIDPPYNTGNKDFAYNDKYIDSEDTWRHSSWLSFMNKRLKLAKELLTEDGFIFISIDDNEVSQLKLLCDSVFGENNFINLVSVKTKNSSGASGGGEDRKLKKNIEYLLIYSKSDTNVRMSTVYKEQNIVDYKNERVRNGTTFPYTSVMVKEGNKEHVKTIQSGNGEDIEILKVTGFEVKPISQLSKEENLSEEQIFVKYFNKIHTTENAQTSIRTRVKEATDSDNTYYIARYRPISGRNKGKLTDVGFMGKTKRLVSYLYNVAELKGNKVVKKDKIGNLWDDLSWAGIKYEGGVVFDNGKKPLKFLKRILSLIPNENALILDFFAGSGTTGQAVLELNQEIGGNRKFILCTNNEISFEKTINYLKEKDKINGSSKRDSTIAYADYKDTEDYILTINSKEYQKLGICQSITYERLKSVINGFNATNGNELAGIPSNLKYFKVNTIETADNQLEIDDVLIENIVPFVQFKHNVWEQETVAEDLISITNESESVFVYSNTLYLCDGFYESINSSIKTKTLYIYDGLFEFLDESRLANVNILSITNEFYKN